MLDANAVARIAAEALLAYGGLDGGEDERGGFTVEEPPTHDFSVVVRSVAIRLRDEGIEVVGMQAVPDVWPRDPQYPEKYVYIPPKEG